MLRLTNNIGHRAVDYDTIKDEIQVKAVDEEGNETIFPSIGKASRTLGISTGSISTALNRKVKKSRGRKSKKLNKTFQFFKIETSSK